MVCIKRKFTCIFSMFAAQACAIKMNSAIIPKGADIQSDKFNTSLAKL